MTSIEDWSLSTLSSQIFRQQTQLQLRTGNSKFFGGRPSWKATGPTGLQLRSGNSRFGGGPSWKATGLQLQSANSWFIWWQTKATATTAIWELEFWVADPVGKWATTANLGTRGFLWWHLGFLRRALENSLSMALSTLLSGQPMYVLVYCAAVSGVRWSGMFLV